MTFSGSSAKPLKTQVQAVARQDGSRIILPDIWTTMAEAGIVMENHGNDATKTQPISEEPKTPEKKRKRCKRTMFTAVQRQILLTWLRNHRANPYPTTKEKMELMEATGLMREQINVWFTNNRVRRKMRGESTRKIETLNSTTGPFQFGRAGV